MAKIIEIKFFDNINGTCMRFIVAFYHVTPTVRQYISHEAPWTLSGRKRGEAKLEDSPHRLF